MIDPLEAKVNKAIADAIKKSADNFEKSFLGYWSIEERHNDNMKKQSPFKDVPIGVDLYEKEDWRVGMVRLKEGIQMIDFYHKHGIWPLQKLHYAGCIFRESDLKRLHCTKCKEPVPSEVVTAVRLLVDI